jgi:hypothetical protein
MDDRVKKLSGYFIKNGWKLIGSVDVKQEWWFEDIILLESVCNPIGKQLYLTLNTDPIEIKRKIVWAISISTELPEEKNYKSISQITLNDIKKTDLDNFVKSINDLILR